MQLKKNGDRLVRFVIDFVNGDMSRWEFDLDYSGYVVDYFPGFEEEHPRLARKFADTIDVAYDHCSWMEDEPFRQAIGEAVDEFLGRNPMADIY